MAPQHFSVVLPADPVPTLNSGTSVNYLTNLTPSSVPPAPESIATSHNIGSQSAPVEWLPPTLISSPATLWQDILNASAVKYLSNATFYVTDGGALLQQLFAMAGSENTEDLGNLKLEKDGAIADMARHEDPIRLLEAQFETALTLATQQPATPHTHFPDAPKFDSPSP